MSPRASEFLWEALERYDRVGENRLTELFAHLLASDPESRMALEDSFGLTRQFEKASITTQLMLQNRRRVDMEVHFQDESARYVVWVEAKIDTREQDDQLLDYAREMAARYGSDGTVVALAPSDHPILKRAREEHELAPGVTAQLAVPLTWQQVGERLDDVGQDRGGGPRWRRDATGAGAPGAQRILAEFLAYLERRALMMNDDPLNLTDGLVASGCKHLFDRTSGSISRILDRAAIAVGGPFADSKPDPWYWPAGDFSFNQGRTWSLPAESWPTIVNPEGGGDAQLWFAPSDVDAQHLDCLEQPVFVASVTIYTPTPSMLDAFSEPAWRSSISPMAVVTEKRHIQISKLRYFGELVSAGITLTMQAEALAEWAEQSFEELLNITPPAVSLM